MIRVEAFPYMDVAVVRVTGICNGGTHEGPKCEGNSLITQVSVEELERLGVPLAINRAVGMLMDAHPDLGGYLMH